MSKMPVSIRLAAAILLALAATGADAKKKPPKVIETPKTPAEMFAKHSEYQDAELSPTGAYVAVTTPFEERRALSIIKLSGDYDTNVIKFAKHEIVANATWVGDERLIVQKAIDVGTLSAPQATGSWYASDADASNQVQLWGYIPDDGTKRGRLKDEGFAQLMKRIEGSDNEAMFYFWPWTAGSNAVVTSMYKVDTKTGTRHQVESIPDSVSIITDRAGNARFIQAVDGRGEQYLRYRRNAGDGEWAPVPKALAGTSMEFMYFESDNDHYYASISDKGEAGALYRVSISAGTRERIGGNPDLEPIPISIGYGAAPYGARFSGGRPKIDFLDAKSPWAQLHAGLMKAFPGELVELINVSKDQNTVLFFVHSDRHPGAYYLYDRKTNMPSLLFESMPWIDPAKMAPKMPLEFNNRNGDKIFAFYTAPVGKQGPLPLVVMPHGGPFRTTDDWSYDPDVQYLASLGYAVLQVNFRGSSQRGEAFAKAAWRGWGTTIQDDITDGVKAVVAQNLADKDRICIYGGSFGGYSAMMNPIRNPGMYKCAIGYAGVYDLGVWVEDHDNSKRGRAWLDYELGTSPASLDAQSPARHADQVGVPVLLIHGRSDEIAGFKHFEKMKAALEKAGTPVDSLVKGEEGHGFYSESNQAEAYERIAAFLKKYNPAD
jgi:dienelactone hydrolase